jgi:uncharacterized membrane protein
MDVNSLAAILGMGLATYLTRAGGLWLVRSRGMPGWAERSLGYLPGAVLMSILAPVAVRSSPAEWVGLGLTAWLVRRTGSLAAGLLAGVALVAAWRNLFPG